MDCNVYIATFFEHLRIRLADILPKGTTIVFLKTRGVFETVGKLSEVPELEDDALASKIEVMFADIPVIARYRKKLVNLKWVHTPWNGVDILMKSFEKDEPFPRFMLTKTQGSVNAALITDYVIGYVIANERRFFQAMESQQISKWQQLIYAYSRGLSSLTIGILGVGGIGQHLAKTCKTFGMTVWGLSRRAHSPENRCPDIDVYKTPEELVDLLENCDYICNVLPSTPSTRDLLSGDILKHCSHKKSVFINVGRGDVVDEHSIAKAINNGWLGGAVLDVFKDEPLPSSSPLWTLPGVIVTPHVSGWSSESEHMDSILDCFLNNLQRYVEGRPLVGILDWSQGY